MYRGRLRLFMLINVTENHPGFKLTSIQSKPDTVTQEKILKAVTECCHFLRKIFIALIWWQIKQQERRCRHPRNAVVPWYSSLCALHGSSHPPARESSRSCEDSVADGLEGWTGSAGEGTESLRTCQLAKTWLRGDEIKLSAVIGDRGKVKREQQMNHLSHNTGTRRHFLKLPGLSGFFIQCMLRLWQTLQDDVMEAERRRDFRKQLDKSLRIDLLQGFKVSLS